MLKKWFQRTLQAPGLCFICLGSNFIACDNAQSAEIKSTNGLSKNAIYNSKCVVFNLGDGPNPVVQLQNGRFKSDNIDGLIKDGVIAQGKLDGQPSAVALIIWSTGGTACFEELALFRLRKGKVCCTGIYSLEDRANINKLNIQNNEVVLDWLKHAGSDPATSPSGHEVLRLKSKQFTSVL